ncbi:MAG TPA: hypothetical protein RMH26_24610, partial [Polyangiaceae bacterium LLY-WYZ-15_(1-7)]|nr:hypothetical protein [Polyangiaceae bacterium LLY-WYZ-15_(1-7)]
WTPEPGHGYAKLWLRWHAGFAFHDASGDRLELPRYHELFVGAYADVGLADGLALFFRSDLLRTFHLEDPRSGDVARHLAPGDPSLGLRARVLLRDRWAMSLQASARAPLARSGEVQEVVRDRAPYPVVGGLRRGAGVWHLQGMWNIGAAFERVFLGAALGYQWRGEGFEDRLLWNATLGATLSPRVGARLSLAGAHSLGFGSAPRASTPSGLGNGASWTTASLSADLRVAEGWYLGAALETALLGLRTKSRGLSLALSLGTQY